jgi:hypothetical protein
MSDLSPEARALVEDGHSVLRPTRGDRARVAAALSARIGAATLLSTQQAAAAAGKSILGWQKLAGIISTVAVAGAGTAYLVDQSADADPPVAPPPRVAKPVRAQPLPSPQEEEAEPPVTPEELGEAEPSPASSPRPITSADRFAQEVAILSRATTELRAGRPAAGLRLLEEHQRTFPKGRLAEERRTARIQALCALGRRSEAEAELARLAQSSPRSPHLARAQRACGIH